MASRGDWLATGDFRDNLLKPMPYPKQTDVEIPLLKVLIERGGQAAAAETYPLVARYFRELTEQEQQAGMEGRPSQKKWWNLVQWVRQKLVEPGEIDGSVWGVWKITDAGRARVAAGDPYSL